MTVLHKGSYFIELQGPVSLKSVPRSISVERYTRNVDVLLFVEEGKVIQVGASVVLHAANVSFGLPAASIKALKDHRNVAFWPHR